MGENTSVPAANAIYGRDLARIRRMDQLAAAAGRLIQDVYKRQMRSGMMSPMQMTSTTSDQLGCHASRKYRSMQYSTPIAIDVYKRQENAPSEADLQR